MLPESAPRPSTRVLPDLTPSLQRNSSASRQTFFCTRWEPMPRTGLPGVFWVCAIAHSK